MSGPLKVAHYPFPAVYGMEQVKKALMCAIANPRVKTVLIRGASGTGKTLVARSIGEGSGKSIVNVPLNVTDEQLFGCLDIESAIKEGNLVLQEGLLQRADGNILYMDDVNLFEQRMINGVIEAVLSGKVKIERENMSTSYEVDTILVATMNIHDSYLSPVILDHFDICVDADYPDDEPGRTEILRRSLAFDADPDAFCEKYAEEEKAISEKIQTASKIIDEMKIDDEVARTIAEISGGMDIDGSRGDLSAINVAMSLAALDGRKVMAFDDIEDAAVFTLAHRRKVPKGRRVDQMEKVVHSSVGFNTESRAIFKAVHPDRENPDIDAVELGEEDEGPDGDVLATAGEKRVYMGAEQEDVISKIGETFKTIDLFERNEGKARGATKNKGKRSLQQSGNRDGRYVGSRITEDKNPDLAFDATVRAAAPYQRKRHAEQASDMAVIIEKTDMREKIREARTSSTFLFAVDTSGSLIIRNRMTAVKGAILSLLQEHYVKKDRVGFVTFNEKSIDMLLQPSREVEVIYKMLDELAIGKRTPLSAALQYLSDYMSMYTKKRPNDECFVVLVTDGGANVPLDPEDKETDPLEEALGIARRMNLPSVKWIVIDSEKRTDKAHYAKDFADALRARYYTLDELRIETREQQNLIRVAKQRIMK